MTIHLGGLASGLDTNSIVDGLVKAETIPITALQTSQSVVTSAASTMSSFLGQLSALHTAAQAISTPVGFSAWSATSSSTAVVATSTGPAAAGNYTFTVDALASEQRTYSDPQASSTAALNVTGGLALTVGSGAATPISLVPTDSLATVATKINQSGARVSANVLFDGTGYRLQIRGKDTGAANAVTFAEQGFSLGLGTPGNTKQPAADAKLTVDGIPMTRSTNQVSGLITGVTLALTQTSSTPVSVKVAPDGKGLERKVQTFVDAYNSLVATGQSSAGYGALQAANKTLAGDHAIRSTLEKLQGLVGPSIAGTTGKYTTLGSLGMGSTKDGKLSFDTTTFEGALSADSEAVTRAFVTDANTGATGIMGTFMHAIDSLSSSPTSIVRARIETLNQQSTRMGKEITAMQARVASYQTQLRKQFQAMENVVSKYKTQGALLGGGSGTGTL